MAAVDPRKIGQILVEKGVVSLPQLEQALEEQRTTGRFLGEILVGRGVAKEEAVARALSEQLGFAYVDVSEMAVEDRAVDLVPKEICEKHTLVPVFVSQNTLTIAMANALDVAAVDKVQALTGLRVRPVFACPSAIRKILAKRAPSSGGAPASSPASPAAVPPTLSMETILGSPAPGISSGAIEGTADKPLATNQRPVIERVNEIIERAVEMGASDIHLEPEKIQLVCRYRIDGILHTLQPVPVEEHAAIVSRVKIMADMDIAEKRLPQDGRIRLIIRGREIDLRVSTFPSIHGENLVIRILDRSGGLISLNDIGFSFKNLETFQKMVRRPYGMILVTGPTGSGKTTTLYAALSEINDSRKNIITLEDPVEYELANVRQSQINAKAGLTFATGLRSVVRQDPDVIMIGEIRDRETAEIAIHAALTGHLVVSTLHTNDAPSAAARLIDMGVEPFLVSTSVIGILAQRLLRTLCTACKSAYRPSEDLLLLLGLKPEEHAQTVFYREKGCERCKQFGYLGRTGIYELMVPTDKIRDLISRKVSAAVIKEEACKQGMRTLRDAGIEKAVSGQTSVAEVLRVTEEI